MFAHYVSPERFPRIQILHECIKSLGLPIKKHIVSVIVTHVINVQIFS